MNITTNKLAVLALTILLAQACSSPNDELETITTSTGPASGGPASTGTTSTGGQAPEGSAEASVHAPAPEPVPGPTSSTAPAPEPTASPGGASIDVKFVAVEGTADAERQLQSMAGSIATIRPLFAPASTSDTVDPSLDAWFRITVAPGVDPAEVIAELEAMPAISVVESSPTPQPPPAGNP